MIDYLRVLTQKGATTEQVDAAEKFTDFSTWIGIYGSDSAVKAFHNLMQAAYQNPPPAILLRLYGDFMIEARKDMGYPDTTVQYEHLLGMKINNIYVEFKPNRSPFRDNLLSSELATAMAITQYGVTRAQITFTEVYRPY